MIVKELHYSILSINYCNYKFKHFLLFILLDLEHFEISNPA